MLRPVAGIERCRFRTNVPLKPSGYPGHGRGLANGFEAVFSSLNQMHRESLGMIGRRTDPDLEKRCVIPGGTPITVWKWWRAMVEPEAHHHGQIYFYWGMLDVAMPRYGLVEEEPRERSVPGVSAAQAARSSQR